MPGRGETQKQISRQAIVLERKMVTRHYRMTWDLERCVGCEIGPTVCPKEAVIHVPGKIENGRLVERPAVDIDAKKCVFCGICEVMCPKNAITLTINQKRENPVLAHGAFALPTQGTTFDPAAFDWQRRQLVIDNCPTHVISYDDQAHTLRVDDGHCIRCRQCEIAGNGAFQVVQPWEGRVDLHRERCVEGCLACADICPTRALYVDTEDAQQLALADYYCIKCGACMQVCPVRPAYEELYISITAQGVAKTVRTKRLINAEQLPIRVKRWRIKHQPVQSAAWLDALKKLADDKAGAVEIDRKRALRRRDLLKALVGSKNHLR